MIKLRNISKTYHRGGQTIQAVKNVSLDINDGEIFGVIGFSGAGKSTLVRNINLLERPDEGGIVEVNGQDLTKLSAKELRKTRSTIGMIFQQFNLMPSRTVIENVIYPLAGKGLSRKEQENKALALLQKVDLANRAHAYPSELSGGQKQRVAIARALATDPKILLCDEATSALDPTTTHEILELIKKLNEELHLTIVVITHEMAVVKDICHRVAVMEHGHVVELGDTFSVFANPKEEVTRNFVRAASNLSKADLIAKLPADQLGMKPGEKLVRLSYLDKTVSEPLISTVSQRFNIIMNILFADVELVTGSPIGGTCGIFSGDPQNVENALQWLRDKNVKVEVLLNA